MPVRGGRSKVHGAEEVSSAATQASPSVAYRPRFLLPVLAIALVSTPAAFLARALSGSASGVHLSIAASSPAKSRIAGGGLSAGRPAGADAQPRWGMLRAPREAAAMSAAAGSLDEVLRDVVRVAEEAGREAAAVVKARLGADVIKSKASRGDLLTEVDGAVEKLIEARVRAAFPSHGFLGEESVPAGAKASAEAIGAAMAASSFEWLWICDPIDGTTNFVQSFPIVGISIGVARRDATGLWQLVAGVIVDPFKEELFSAYLGGGASLNGEPIRVSAEPLSDSVIATGFAPNEASLQPMVRGIIAVGTRARTVRMLGSAAIMLAWVACGRLSAYFEADLNAWDTAAGVLLIREAGGEVTELTGAPFDISSRPILATNSVCHAELRDVLDEAAVVGLDPV